MVESWSDMVVATGDEEEGSDARESLNDGYHLQGRQQAPGLRNPTRGGSDKENITGPFGLSK